MIAINQVKAAAIAKSNADAAVKAALEKIDIESIREIRAYIAGKNDAPQLLKENESKAIAEREKLK